MAAKRGLGDAQATLAYGRELAAELRQRPGDTWLYLRGPLGAGKSTLTRGLLRALGHEGPVPSPTYAIAEPYLKLKPPVWHLDLYRIASPEELDFLGLERRSDGPRIVIVEWPEHGTGWLPSADVAIDLDYDDQGGRTLMRQQ